jgi:hypothetical protein
MNTDLYTYEREWREEMRENGLPENRISELWVAALMIGNVIVDTSGLKILDEVAADVGDYIAKRWDKWVAH